MANKKKSEYITRQIQTKITNSADNALREASNHWTNGNVSKMVRIMIDDWLEMKSKEKGMPASVRLAIKRRQRKRIQEYKAQLYADWVSLQLDYDEEFEQDLIEFAKEKGLKYPPEERFEKWEYDENLSKVLGAVHTLCNGNGETTLRDVYRATGHTQRDCLRHLEELKDLGKVDFVSPNKNETCTIMLV